MIKTVILMTFMVLQISFARNPYYNECTDDICDADYNPTDPRNQALDLYNDISGKMVDTIPMPDFELYASFYGGSLFFNYFDSMDTLCVCPLTENPEEWYAVFHDDLLIDLKYNWTLQWSPYYSYNGSMEVAAQVYFNVYFINQTNGNGPSVDRINITTFDIFSWYFDGQPFDMLSVKIPDESFKKTMRFVLKQTFENNMVSVYNKAIEDMKGNFQTFNTSKRRSAIRLLDFLKSRRKINSKRSKYSQNEIVMHF